MDQGAEPKRPSDERHELELGSVGVPARGELSTAAVDILAQVSAEDVWLAGLRSSRTRRAYRLDVADFIDTLSMTSSEELYRVRPAAVLAWRESLEARDLKPTTLRRKLSALSSLFKHLVEQQLAEFNPVRDVKRPAVNRSKGKTAAFSQEQARAILDAPPTDTIIGLRDRAMLSVGMQLGPRRAEIAHLTVGDLHMDNGLWCLRLVRKGSADRDSEVINPQTHARIVAYLEEAGHGGDLEGPLFRPTRRGTVEGPDALRRHLAPNAIDRRLRHWCEKALGITHGFSAHSMRATFITHALDNGAKLEYVQKAAGHADPSTTKLYDRRGNKPEEAAAFFANY